VNNFNDRLLFVERWYARRLADWTTQYQAGNITARELWNLTEHDALDALAYRARVKVQASQERFRRI
jgi:hypothetical protein